MAWRKVYTHQGFKEAGKQFTICRKYSMVVFLSDYVSMSLFSRRGLNGGSNIYCTRIE